MICIFWFVDSQNSVCSVNIYMVCVNAVTFFGFFFLSIHIGLFHAWRWWPELYEITKCNTVVPLSEVMSLKLWRTRYRSETTKVHSLLFLWLSLCLRTILCSVLIRITQGNYAFITHYVQSCVGTPSCKSVQSFWFYSPFDPGLSHAFSSIFEHWSDPCCNIALPSSDWSAQWWNRQTVDPCLLWVL